MELCRELDSTSWIATNLGSEHVPEMSWVVMFEP